MRLPYLSRKPGFVVVHFGRRTVRLSRVVRIVVLAVAVAVVVAILLWPREQIFTLDGRVEVVSFSVADPLVSRWRLGRVDLLEDPFAGMSSARRLEGTTLEVARGTQVGVLRHGVGGVRIRLAAEAGRSAGSLIGPAGEAEALGDWALVVVEPDERPLVLPFRGQLTAGDDVAAEVDSMLLSGRVSIVEEQLSGRTRYVAGVRELDPGDRVQFRRESSASEGENAVALVDGFVRAEPAGFSEATNALALVAHGAAGHVEVHRLGSAGYRIRAKRWARFVHDPLVAGFTAAVALTALLLEFISKVAGFFKDDAEEGSTRRAGTGGGERASRPDGEEAKDEDGLPVAGSSRPDDTGAAAGGAAAALGGEAPAGPRPRG